MLNYQTALFEIMPAKFQYKSQGKKVKMKVKAFTINRAPDNLKAVNWVLQHENRPI